MSESALDAEARVMALMEEYAERSGRALSTVSRYCSGSGTTYRRMSEKKWAITGARMQKIVQWIRDNWQDGWPEPEWPVAFELAESKLEFMLHQQMCQADLPIPRQQYSFAPMRRYRADFAWPEHRLLVEVEGGLWSGGKHAIAQHETKRQRRRCYAQALGWSIIEVSPPDVRNGNACKLIARWLEDPHSVCQLLDELGIDETAKEVLA